MVIKKIYKNKFQYLYSSFLNGPSYGIPIYSAYYGDKEVNLAPKLAKCNLATFSSKCFGKT